MNIWPEIDLTEYERLFVRHYKTIANIKGKDGKTKRVLLPGVLKRVYHRYLINQAVEGFYVAPIFEQQIKISRRSRVFGIMFSGDVHAWTIRLQSSAGTLYTLNTDPAADNRSLVTSMIEGSNFNIFAQIGSPFEQMAGVDSIQAGAQSFPMLIEPNWSLTENDSFIINGQCQYPTSGENARVGILGISVHVWEFPGMEASTDSRAG